MIQNSKMRIMPNYWLEATRTSRVPQPERYQLKNRMIMYAIKPRATFRSISRIVLILLSIGLLAIAKSINIFLIGALSVYLIVAALLIRVRDVEIHDDHFVIHGRCWLKRFSGRSEFRYSDIKKISFSPGYTNWPYVMLLAVTGIKGGLGHGETCAASEWVIVKSDNSIEYINSIGTDEEAEKAAKYIESRLRSFK